LGIVGGIAGSELSAFPMPVGVEGGEPTFLESTFQPVYPFDAVTDTPGTGEGDRKIVVGQSGAEPKLFDV
jgi:hypothetical protein